MKTLMLSMLALTMSTTISLIQCMETPGILIKTSDNQERRLTQQIIETSRLLHTKQQSQAFKEKYHGAKPAPITLKTISAEQLDLYSEAVNTQDFTTHFKELSPKQKNLLIRAAGQAEFDSAYVTSQLLSTCFTSDIIETNINPHLPTLPLADYLQGLIIKNNCEQKKFTHKQIQPSQCYAWSNQQRSYNSLDNISGNCYALPEILHSTQSMFSGITHPKLMKFSLTEPNKAWLIEDCSTPKNMAPLYFLTPIDPVNDNDKFAQMGILENKKCLWAITDEKNDIIPKIIEHTSIINHYLFSNDGKYFVTASEDSDILFTELTIKDNVFIDSDFFLTGHTGYITAIRFNEQSTIFAAAAVPYIYFWDVKKRLIVQQLPCPDAIVNSINFNKDNTRLITIMRNLQGDSFIVLWNISDISNIIPIRNIPFIPNYEHIDGVSFTPSGDKIVIETKQRALTLDGLTGEIILNTGIINDNHMHNNDCVNAVLIPDQPILAAIKHYTNKPSAIGLWDLNTKKQIGLLENLSEQKKNIVGIGVSANGRYIVAIDNNSHAMQITLYDEITGNCLNWLTQQPNLLQRYLLLRLYNAHKNNDAIALDPDSAAYRILQTLPTAPYNIKEIIEQYLLRPFEKDWKDTCSDFFEKFVTFFNQKS